MERLTFRTGKKTYIRKPYGVCSANRPVAERMFCVNCPGPQDRKKCMPLMVIDRLAAYEDTELEPEDVKEHEAAYIEIMTRTYGPFRQKIRQWMQAEKDGRLVVLPDVNERDRKAFVDGLQDYFQEASFYDPSTGIFGMSDGEKELASALMNALTCEEAEAALKKREEEDNEAD